MAPALQSELFAFLTDESRERLKGTAARPVRIIAGSNFPLLSYVEDGSFDEALMYRLNVVHIVVADAAR